jgi:hypothetical protein
VLVHPAKHPAKSKVKAMTPVRDVVAPAVPFAFRPMAMASVSEPSKRSCGPRASTVKRLLRWQRTPPVAAPRPQGHCRGGAHGETFNESKCRASAMPIRSTFKGHSDSERTK